jgi:hypothetical protein
MAEGHLALGGQVQDRDLGRLGHERFEIGQGGAPVRETGMVEGDDLGRLPVAAAVVDGQGLGQGFFVEPQAIKGLGQEQAGVRVSACSRTQGLAKFPLQ